MQLAWSPMASVTADTDGNGFITAVHLNVQPGQQVTVDVSAGVHSRTIGPIDNTAGVDALTQSWTLPQPFDPSQSFGISLR